MLSSTWTHSGHGGDLQATDDAVLAAARLRGPTAPPAALAAANPSRRAGRVVRASASQLRATQRAFFGYCHWQVVYGDTSCPRAPPPGHTSPRLIAPLAPPSGPR